MNTVKHSVAELTASYGLNFEARDWAEAFAANADTQDGKAHWNAGSDAIVRAIRKRQATR